MYLTREDLNLAYEFFVLFRDSFVPSLSTSCPPVVEEVFFNMVFKANRDVNNGRLHGEHLSSYNESRRQEIGEMIQLLRMSMAGDIQRGLGSIFQLSFFTVHRTLRYLFMLEKLVDKLLNILYVEDFNPWWDFLLDGNLACSRLPFWENYNDTWNSETVGKLVMDLLQDEYLTNLHIDVNLPPRTQLLSNYKLSLMRLLFLKYLLCNVRKLESDRGDSYTVHVLTMSFRDHFVSKTNWDERLYHNHYMLQTRRFVNVPLTLGEGLLS